MASGKRIGFYWGEEKITIVEFDKNIPGKIASMSLGLKSNSPSPFSSNLTEEIQLTAILQKLLQDNQIVGGSFYVALPMKEIILRSFVIPYVRPEEIQGAVKFEAKKYVPFDMQELSFVYHTFALAEGQNKRLQVVLFAVRKDALARYERIFKQVNADIVYCEPFIVSLSKALLFKKEIKSNDHFAFLVLDKNIGRISFIDQCVPQFIREFPTNPLSVVQEGDSPEDTLNSKIVTEVGNSFDFYARQFTAGERVEQMLVSADFVQKDLLGTLEREVRVKIRKFSPVINTVIVGQSNDMDAVYALGACITPTVGPLAQFNFLEDKVTQSSQIYKKVASLLHSYKEVLMTLFVCILVVTAAHYFFVTQLNSVQKQYDQTLKQENSSAYESQDSIQSEYQQNVTLLQSYKEIKVKSDMAFIILRLASHLPRGALLSQLDVQYNDNGINVTVDMNGDVYEENPDEQIAIVNHVYSSIKDDKVLAQYFSRVDLGSINNESVNGQVVTGFVIRCY